MKFKINIKLLIMLCALICLIMSALVIRSTYARYITSLTTKSYVEMGSWSIKINNQNIIDNSNFTSVITPVFNTTSDYIASNKIAPTSVGYAEFSIDYSEVKVPFKYELTFSQDDPNAEESTYLKDFILTTYQIDSTQFSYTDGAIISDTISPDGITTSTNLYFNFTWADNGELTDIQDTKYSRDVQNIKLNFNIVFTQIT